MGQLQQDDLVEIGTLLFGTRWQSDLARELNTSDRMVRYWVAGTHARPADLHMRLKSLLQERVNRMTAMIAHLERSTGENE